MHSIVPAGKLNKDPQTLLYFFPSIPSVRYVKLTRDYIYWKYVQIAEQACRTAGRLLVPGDCLHHKRRRQLADRRIVIQRTVYFSLAESELTRGERKKYLSLLDKNAAQQASAL